MSDDYLTGKEAAEYCRMSYTHFIRNRRKLGIPTFPFMGKKLYRKTDLVSAIEKHLSA